MLLENHKNSMSITTRPCVVL